MLLRRLLTPPITERTRLSRLWRLFGRAGYQPHPAQWEFHRSTARFRVLVAGSRFGKSRAAAMEALAALLAGRDRRVWIVGPCYSLAEKEFRYLVAAAQRLGIIRKLRYAGDHMRLWCVNGSEAEVRSAARPASLLGEEVDLLIVAEAAQVPREAVERYLRPRLVSRRGALIVPTTPRGYGWVQEFYERGLDPAANPGWRSWQFSTAQNPTVAADEIADARRALPASIFAEQFEGKFVAEAGLVYPEFSREVHVLREISPDPSWRWYRAVDFGFRNPFVCLYAAVDGDGVVRVAAETSGAGLTVDQIVERILARPGVYDLTVVDPSAPFLVRALVAAGVRAVGADHDLFKGIAAVRRALHPSPKVGPALFLAESCARTIREFGRYVFPETRSGEPPSEVPHKGDDHAMDALRYLLLALSPPRGWRRGA
ncbi:MAG: hypothetical protein HY719_06655 [Planctomycetes bacterium]|nr:hypothetical protein [Planctomycetota bacterium]